MSGSHKLIKTLPYAIDERWSKSNGLEYRLGSPSIANDADTVESLEEQGGSKTRKI